jgi:hypothetical protein
MIQVQAVDPPTFAALFIISASFYEVLRLLVGHLFGRFISPGFVKTSDCAKCSEKNSANDEEMKQDIKAIKRALISIAMQKPLTAEDIQKLAG